MGGLCVFEFDVEFLNIPRLLISALRLQFERHKKKNLNKNL